MIKKSELAEMDRLLAVSIPKRIESQESKRRRLKRERKAWNAAHSRHHGWDWVERYREEHPEWFPTTQLIASMPRRSAYVTKRKVARKRSR